MKTAREEPRRAGRQLAHGIAWSRPRRRSTRRWADQTRRRAVRPSGGIPATTWPARGGADLHEGSAATHVVDQAGDSQRGLSLVGRLRSGAKWPEEEELNGASAERSKRGTAMRRPIRG